MSLLLHKSPETVHPVFAQSAPPTAWLTAVKSKLREAVYSSLTPLIKNSERDPMFVVGTGRCGTTLLINLLGTHSQLLDYPGEANTLWHPNSYPYPKRTIETPRHIVEPGRFTELSVQSWPENYREHIQKEIKGYWLTHGPRRTMVVKSAMISFLMPELAEMFPNGRFLHIYRNGPAVVASFEKFFKRKEWLKYTDEASHKAQFRQECAQYWGDCLFEIDHQKTALGLEQSGKFYEFSYESLCDAPRQILDDIADFFQVRRDGFGYDLSQIVSQNYKVGSDYTNDPDWQAAIKVMEPAMKLKGYL